MPESKPIEKRPAAEAYPLATLELTDHLTRESHLARFGEQAPPFDPAKTPKDWL
jgi:hypothetical protein